MTTLRKQVLTLVLLLTGFLAGLQVLMLIGVLPAMTRMSLTTYAGMWQAMDHFMAARMPVFANGTLLLYLITILCFARSNQRAIFWALLGCFILLVGDTVLTVTQQLPVNHSVQALDVDHLTDTAHVQQLRDITIQHFYIRGGLAIAAFVWLAFATVFSLGGQQVTPPQGTQS